MKKILTLTLCLLMAVASAQAQAFWKRHDRYERRYIAQAVTGPVQEPSRPSVYARISPGHDIYRFTNVSIKELNHRMKADARKKRKEQRDAARLARQVQHDKYRDEQRALGTQLASHKAPRKGLFR